MLATYLNSSLPASLVKLILLDWCQSYLYSEKSFCVTVTMDYPITLHTYNPGLEQSLKHSFFLEIIILPQRIIEFSQQQIDSH